MQICAKPQNSQSGHKKYPGDDRHGISPRGVLTPVKDNPIGGFYYGVIVGDPETLDRGSRTPTTAVPHHPG